MRCTTLAVRALAVLGLIGCAATTADAPDPKLAEGGAPPLWMQVAGSGEPTVLFEAGSGDDHSVWAEIEPAVRKRSGVRTVVYDHAGLGKSAPAPGPYRIDDEVAALRRALDRFGVRDEIVVVAHSYGGFVATMLAASDARVVGAVFVDAHVVEYFDDARLAQLASRSTSELAALERSDAARARVLAPILRSLPDTVRRVRSTPLPATIPVIDIVAERSWGETAEDNAALQRAHAAFVAASPARVALPARGAGHYVMRDQPELVIDAIARLLLYIHHS